MFERFTEKARRVIFHARYEASGFGSPYIETEFLLLGMLREDRHAILRWLGEEDAEFRLREEIVKRVSKGPKTPTSIDLPLSDESKQVLTYAAEEATILSHAMIGVEHLFLGVVRDERSRAGKMLLDMGVNAQVVRETLAREGAQSSIRTGSRTVAGQRSLQMLIVPEGSEAPLQLSWHSSRIPAVGETLTIHGNQDSAATYQVVNVVWDISSVVLPPSLSKVAIHVRRLEPL